MVTMVNKNGIMMVDLGDRHTITFDTREYDAFTYGYAATVHKLQGATIDKCYVLASEGFDRHLSYVAMSRHRYEMNLYYGKDQFQNLEHLKRTFSSLAEKELIKDFAEKEKSVERLLKNLTGFEATFTQQQLDKALSGLNDDERSELLARIVEVGEGTDGHVHFSTDEMMALEDDMFLSAERLGRQNIHTLDPKKFSTDSLLVPAQRFAMSRTLGGNDLSIVESQYPVDKNNLAKQLAKIYQDQGYMVDAVTLSGAGAHHFQKATGIVSTTTFKRIWELDHGKNRLTDHSVLIVDNANMIGTRHMARLIYEAEAAKAKVILLGDRQLTQSVSAGGAYRGIIERCPKKPGRYDPG